MSVADKGLALVCAGKLSLCLLTQPSSSVTGNFLGTGRQSCSIPANTRENAGNI